MHSPLKRLREHLRSLYLKRVGTPLASLKWLVRGPDGSWSLPTTLVTDVLHKITAGHGIGHHNLLSIGHHALPATGNQAFELSSHQFPQLSAYLSPVPVGYQPALAADHNPVPIVGHHHMPLPNHHHVPLPNHQPDPTAGHQSPYPPVPAQPYPPGYTGKPSETQGPQSLGHQTIPPGAHQPPPPAGYGPPPPAGFEAAFLAGHQSSGHQGPPPTGYQAPLPPLKPRPEAMVSAQLNGSASVNTHSKPFQGSQQQRPTEPSTRIDAQGYAITSITISYQQHLQFLRRPIHPYSHTYADPKTRALMTAYVEPENVKAYWIVPPELQDSHRGEGKVIMAMHGGGYLNGYPLFPYFFRLARKARCRILTVHYRLGKHPDTRFPAAIQDAAVAYSHLLGSWSPSQITFLGDSAGGGLACALSVYLTSQSLPLPGRLCLLSPWLDMTGANESHHHATLDYVTPLNFFWAGSRYVRGDRNLLSHPLVSPELADWISVGDQLRQDGGIWPQTLIVWGDYETLTSEEGSLSRKLVVDAGVPEDQVQSIAWREMVHDYGFLPDADAADLRTMIAEWLDDHSEEGRIARFRSRRAGRIKL